MKRASNQRWPALVSVLELCSDGYKPRMSGQQSPKLAVRWLEYRCQMVTALIKEKEKGRMSVDENDVRKVQSTLSNWVNPFLKSDSNELCHIASGMTASKKVEEDLCTAYDKGKEAMTAFIRKRLTTNEISFHDHHSDTYIQIDIQMFLSRIPREQNVLV